MLKKTENVPKEIIEALVILYNEEKFEQIISKKKELVELCAESFLFFKLIGSSYLELKQFKKAIYNFKQAIQINPNDNLLYYNLGLAFHLDGNLDEALINYKKVLKFKHDNAEVYNNISIIYKEKNNLNESLFFIEEAIKIKPNSANFYNNKAVLLKEIGDQELAIKNYELAIKFFPNYLEAYCNLANIQRDMGRLNDSIKNSNKALKIDPNCIEAYFNLGMSKKILGDIKKASQCFKKVIELKNDHHTALHMLNSIEGTTTNSYSQIYISKLFDSYAKNFNKSLVNSLGYNIPNKIAKILISNSFKPLGSILDLGCGTGLVGEGLEKNYNYLEGVDISEKMIEEAYKLKIYDKLCHYDIIEYLKTKTLKFDLFIAADVFTYIGELKKIFNLIKCRNKKNGKLIFTTEHNDKQNFKLEMSGRFSHSYNYIESLCKLFDYDIVYFKKVKLRKEIGEYLIGGLYILKF